MAGIEQAVVGNKVVDVSRAVQRVVEENGFYVVREYTGHGVGRQMHEPPQVLNYVSGDADGEMCAGTRVWCLPSSPWSRQVRPGRGP